VAFLEINNEKIEKECRKTILFTMASKENQIPRNKLNKDVNDLYKEKKYKPLKKHIKEDCRR
jgi:hypothetical protein